MNFMFKNKVYYNRGRAFLSILLVLASIIFIFVFLFQQKKTVCEETLKYSIGTIDNRFDISKGNLIKVASESTDVWKKGTGMDLFKYDPNSTFKINLIFDKRQRDTITERKSKNTVNKNNVFYDKLKVEYNTLKNLHAERFKQYNVSVSTYQNKRGEYNKEVAYWNNNGGAPSKEYSTLGNKRSDLKIMSTSLTKEMNDLNVINKNMNLLADKINNFASKINVDVNKYNNTFGKKKIFDQGEYTGKRINIYQFNNEKDLVIVLAHEFGHALGLDHVKNPESIMYYLTGKQDFNSPTLSKEDIDALKIKCNIK